MVTKEDLAEELCDAFDRALDYLHKEGATHTLMRVALIYIAEKQELYLREYDYPKEENPNGMDLKFNGEVDLLTLMDGIYLFKNKFNDGSIDVITAPLMNVIFIYKKEVPNYV